MKRHLKTSSRAPRGCSLPSKIFTSAFNINIGCCSYDHSYPASRCPNSSSQFVNTLQITVPWCAPTVGSYFCRYCISAHASSSPPGFQQRAAKQQHIRIRRRGLQPQAHTPSIAYGGIYKNFTSTAISNALRTGKTLMHIKKFNINTWIVSKPHPAGYGDLVPKKLTASYLDISLINFASREIYINLCTQCIQLINQHNYLELNSNTKFSWSDAINDKMIFIRDDL